MLKKKNLKILLGNFPRVKISPQLKLNLCNWIY
jgi:hypothetical protein